MSNLVKTRKVTILHTQTSTREVIETSVQTWGDLQKQIEGDVRNKRFVVRETKNTLESSEALLPPGDFVIFGYPKESKAGAAKKAAKKTAKKTAKKVAKKAKPAAKKKAPKRVSTKKSEKISNVVDAVAGAAAVTPPTEEELRREANSVRNTLPRY